MILTYEIRDLFKLLWVKKTIVAAAALLCGLLAVPTAITTYNSAIQNYTQLINKSEEVKAAPTSGMSTNFLILNLPPDSSFDRSVAVSHAVALMNQDIIAKPAWEETRKIVGGKITNYADFKKGLIITPLPTLSLIQIQHGSVEAETISVFIDQLIKQSVTTVPKIIHIPFELQKDTNFFELAEVKTPVNISKAILKEPSKPQNYIKLIGTAALAGILFSCFIILLVDFLKPRVKSKEDLSNNYPVNVLNKRTVAEAIKESNPAITSIIALGLKPKFIQELQKLNLPVVSQPGEISGNSLIVVKAYKTAHADLDACIKSIPDNTTFSVLLV